MGRANATIVRPYGARIHEPLMKALVAAGVIIDPDHVIPAKTDDTRAVERVREIGNADLIVPFHAHRGKRDQELNGIYFLKELRERAEDVLPWRFVMPVSKFGNAGLNLLLSRSGEDLISAEWLMAIQFVKEQELADPDLPERIRAHLAAGD